MLEVGQAYKRQQELINRLNVELETIKASAAKAEETQAALVAQLQEIRSASEALRQSLLNLQEVQERKDKLSEDEIKRLKRSRLKWAIIGGAAGLALGVLVSVGR